MNVLVTGAAGFIGSNLVHYLVGERPSWKITALDSLSYAGNLANIQSLIDRGTISFAKVDITEATEVNKLFAERRFEVVFHLAAESHVDRSIMGASAFVITNVVGTQVLLDATRATNVRRFVHISTDEVYGSLGPTGSFLETTPLDPTSPYSASKASSDLMVGAAHRTHKLDAVITRCTNNYGPYQFPEKFIPLFITNALEDKPLPLYGDGMNVRSWLHVRDHCEALLLAAEKGRSGEVYNIGGSSEAEIPNIQVARTILAQLQKPESLITKVADRLAHDRRYSVDYSKANKELGWAPRTPFATGITSTVAWYKNNRAWWEGIKSGAYKSYYQQQYGDARGAANS
jgi:dTDP-glucose 4,6-dehydratase